jgi:hypothetical protein
VVLIISGSVVGVIAAFLVVVLAVGGLFTPARYLDPWKTGYSSQFSDPRLKLVARALLAPSSHNMQPWTVTLDAADPDVLYLYADPSRLTPAVDPLARQTLVSQGTFLEYLRVAGLALGYSTAFEIFPDGGYSESSLATSMKNVPVARITLSRPAITSSTDAASLFLSDTNRSPYSGTKVTAAQEAELSGLATGSGATLQFYEDAASRKTLGDFGIEGTLIESKYAASTAESDRLFFSTEAKKNSARSGFAVEGQGTSGFMKYLLQGLITLFPSMNDDAAGAKRSIDSTAAAVAHTPAYAMISTPGNTRTEQVEAGILYARFSLRARTLGLVMQPLSQVLQEYPSMSTPYEAIHKEYAPKGETIQMLVRVGTATTDYPPTMRRDASSLVR